MMRTRGADKAPASAIAAELMTNAAIM